MQCEDCRLAAMEPPDGWQRFSPACLDCGARYLWCIQRLQLGQEDKRERLKKVLTDWMAYGHAERALRDGAKRTRKDWKEWARDHHPGR